MPAEFYSHLWAECPKCGGLTPTPVSVDGKVLETLCEICEMAVVSRSDSRPDRMNDVKTELETALDREARHQKSCAICTDLKWCSVMIELDQDCVRLFNQFRKAEKTEQALDTLYPPGKTCKQCGLHTAKEHDPYGRCIHCILNTNRNVKPEESFDLGDS